MEIHIIPHGDPLWERAAACVKACPWRGTRFLMEQMRGNRLHGWERILLAMDGGTVAGFCALLERDWIPDSHTPFLTTLYVEEAYRGRRLSQKLISAASDYLQALGFEAVYLFSDHTGLYEKYGFLPMGTVRSPLGEEERLFRRTLSEP